MSVRFTALRELVSQHPAAVRLLLSRRDVVLCRHKETKKMRQVPIRGLYQNNPRFWEQNASSWEYYIDQATADAIAAQIEAAEQSVVPLEPRPAAAATTTNNAHPQAAEPPKAPAAPPADPAAPPPNFGADYQRIQALSPAQRIELIEEDIAELEAIDEKDSVVEEAAAGTLVRAAGNAAMANRATIYEAIRMGNDQAKEYTRAMVETTKQLVKSSIRVVDSEIYNDELVKRVADRSNGTVVQHMTRVFLTGLEFMLFYNRQVLANGIATRIRTQFTKQYKAFYQKLLPHLHEDHVSLERVFLGGMKALDDTELHRFATGFLVHDVGKADDIEYHEGEAAYDRATVERHVKIGYKAVIEKTAYPHEAALITGYHHEYYGHANGYGYFRDFLQAYKNANPSATVDYVMSFTMEPLLDYEVLAYFPAKMLEIVDVFDSLTDPNRLYRKPLTPREALQMIREQFIEQHVKIDPILFDLFIRYLVENKRLEPAA